MNTRWVLICLLNLTVGIKAQARDCFYNHIKESIHINQESLEFYQKYAGPKVKKIYRQLIAGEKGSLSIARGFDKKAKLYQDQGIDLLCQEFRSMKIDNLREVILKERTDEAFNMSSFSFFLELNKAIESNNLEIIRQTTLDVLLKLKQRPHYHCFARHLVESIYRFAYFAPMRRIQSAQKNLKDPTKLLVKVMKIQLMALPFAHHIDKLSAPFQKQGVPLLCQELPNLIEDIEIADLEELKNGFPYGKN